MVEQGLHKLLFGPPCSPAGTRRSSPATTETCRRATQQQRHFTCLSRMITRARSMNFSKALSNTPNDPTILRNLAFAEQKLERWSCSSRTRAERWAKSWGVHHPDGWAFNLFHRRKIRSQTPLPPL